MSLGIMSLDDQLKSEHFNVMRYEVALATIESLMCKGFSEYPISIPSVQRVIRGKS